MLKDVREYLDVLFGIADTHGTAHATLRMVWRVPASGPVPAEVADASTAAALLLFRLARALDLSVRIRPLSLSILSLCPSFCPLFLLFASQVGTMKRLFPVINDALIHAETDEHYCLPPSYVNLASCCWN